jgi:hypothetical protein
MKKIILVLSAVLIFTSCGNDKKQQAIEIALEAEIVPAKEYPTAINNVFKAHGGMAQWNAMNTLSFRMDNKGDIEVHTIALKSRNEKIEHKNWSIGSDGKELWVLENESESYQGNALFYKNLMFYFYAMPFVVGDDGVVYTQMPATELEGIKYNATKISFEDGVGYSSTDEYIIYSDPASNQMTWLAYTVTGNSGKKSDRWSYIKYAEWQEVNGLQLPKKLSWYKVEDKKPTIPKGDRTFDTVTLTEIDIDTSVFTKPRGAKVVED